MGKYEDILCTILNEDDTEFHPPENPLKEKWSILYPAYPRPNTPQACDGYGCMFCGRCPKGEYWEVPEEDRKVWEEYQKQLKEYHRVHNPSLYKFLCED